MAGAALLGVLAGPATDGCAAGGGEARQEAVDAASAWLLLVDRGEYEASWSEAAGWFRNLVSRDQWVAQAGGVREPLGAVRTRLVRAEQRVTSLPGAPDGDYMVLEFQTEFERKRAAIETVTAMRDTDGRWRVAGYYVR